ncbi:hypothetical protein EVAR_99858_1 [Eumeta japonica]|uniref:Uncharacterized protein n=1 Tax=Eumeta variegata TaxID=151549 RepID=A0A4C1ZKI2_EUMVA|nr:hypothetical protein EVAR_99858_1 [Eumeta japonica]
MQTPCFVIRQQHHSARAPAEGSWADERKLNGYPVSRPMRHFLSRSAGPHPKRRRSCATQLSYSWLVAPVSRAISSKTITFLNIMNTFLTRLNTSPAPSRRRSDESAEAILFKSYDRMTDVASSADAGARGRPAARAPAAPLSGVVQKQDAPLPGRPRGGVAHYEGSPRSYFNNVTLVRHSRPHRGLCSATTNLCARL